MCHQFCKVPCLHPKCSRTTIQAYPIHFAQEEHPCFLDFPIRSFVKTHKVTFAVSHSRYKRQVHLCALSKKEEKKKSNRSAKSL